MNGYGIALFDTAIGRCGVAWSPRGVRAVSFPEADDAQTLAHLQRRVPEAEVAEPPPSVAEAIAGVTAHLAGALDDLTWIVVDYEGAPEMHRRIWAVVRAIPPGRTRTYGEVAVELGDKLLAQTVGQAMGKNPTPIVMPCHRVLAAGAKTGGFSAPGGVETKFRVLQIEGATGDTAQPGLFDDLPLATAPR